MTLDFRTHKSLNRHCQLSGLRTVITGTLLGICRVLLMFTIISVWSLNGGMANIGAVTLHATTPDNALLIPAIVTYTLRDLLAG